MNYGAGGGTFLKKIKLALTFSLATLNQFESSKPLDNFNSENSNLP